MGHTTDTRPTFFRRIAKDKTANTIAISAASLVPLLAMVGGGVDASRYYMAETRLQAACDAGALAGRREMGAGDFTVAAVAGAETPRQVALNFFDQNYGGTLFGTEGLQREYTATADGEVLGEATGTLPTSIMGAFGYDEFDLSVDCQADINISNSDIMFVLDVTGSMRNNMAELRTSVIGFHNTVESASSASAQVRYGVVPYASNVNVGAEIVAENASWMATEHTYQSREADWIENISFEPVSTTFIRTGNGTNFDFQGRIEENDFNVTTFDDCVALINTREDIFVSSSDPDDWTLVSQSGSNPRTSVYDGVVTYESFTFDGGFYRGSTDHCQLYYRHNEYDAVSTITVTEDQVVTREFQWAYRQVPWPVNAVYTSANRTVALPTGWNETDENYTWDGCIEEAESVAQAAFDPLPSLAFDLDINLVPTNDDERWKPVLRNLVFLREDAAGNPTRDTIQTTDDDFDNPASVCPQAAFRLQEITEADLQTYVDSLVANGFTYHDIGMLWGARFLSPNGIFAADNATAPNGDAIARHIVFMTDGRLDNEPDWYTPYGVEWWDQRITGISNEDFGGVEDLQELRHAERFQAACRQARDENISVWVVAFGTPLTQNLIDCATPGRAFAAARENAPDGSPTLEETFEDIAEQIAALRLTQ